MTSVSWWYIIYTSAGTRGFADAKGWHAVVVFPSLLITNTFVFFKYAFPILIVWTKAGPRRFTDGKMARSQRILNNRYNFNCLPYPVNKLMFHRDSKISRVFHYLLNYHTEIVKDPPHLQSYILDTPIICILENIFWVSRISRDLCFLSVIQQIMCWTLILFYNSDSRLLVYAYLITDRAWRTDRQAEKQGSFYNIDYNAQVSLFIKLPCTRTVAIHTVYLLVIVGPVYQFIAGY